MLTQLNPPWPCEIVGGSAQGQTWTGPTGRGMALFAHKLHPDHNIVFLVALDDGGILWEVEHPFVRAQQNRTWGRNTIHRPEATKPG